MVNPADGPRWPDFFIAGAPRCGTTSMYTLLKQHPQIHLAVHKEPHFFGTDLTAQPHTVRDERVYLSLFEGAGPDQITGEGSVWSLRSVNAAEQIAARRPDARIVIMLRDPVAMVRSLHGLYLRTGNEDLPSLADALDAEGDRRAGRRLPPGVYFPEGLIYTEAARCAPGIERFLGVFGAAQVRVVRFEDFAADGPRVYREVLSFLGVDPDFVPEWDLERARRLMRPAVLSQLRALRRAAPWLIDVMRSRGQRHLGPNPPITPELEARLRALLADDVARTAALLDHQTDHRVAR